MINPTREQVATALFSLLQGLNATFNTISRRPALWNNATNMPALYMGQPEEEYEYHAGTATPPNHTMDFDLYVYINSGTDPNAVPDTLLNNCIDAIENLIGGFAYNGMPQTLGNIINHVWIEGKIKRAPGYINGEGLAMLTLKALVPS